MSNPKQTQKPYRRPASPGAGTASLVEDGADHPGEHSAGLHDPRREPPGPGAENYFGWSPGSTMGDDEPRPRPKGYRVGDGSGGYE